MCPVHDVSTGAAPAGARRRRSRSHDTINVRCVGAGTARDSRRQQRGAGAPRVSVSVAAHYTNAQCASRSLRMSDRSCAFSGGARHRRRGLLLVARVHTPVQCVQLDCCKYHAAPARCVERYRKGKRTGKRKAKPTRRPRRWPARASARPPVVPPPRLRAPPYGLTQARGSRTRTNTTKTRKKGLENEQEVQSLYVKNHATRGPTLHVNQTQFAQSGSKTGHNTRAALAAPAMRSAAMRAASPSPLRRMSTRTCGPNARGKNMH